MNPRTSIVLVILCIALGLGVWWQLHREQVEPPIGPRPLIEGLDRTRVHSFRLDQLVYSLQLEIKQDDAGRWQIVDPLTFPADETKVGWLLDVVSQNTAVAAVGVDPKKVGLDQPRAVLEVREEIAGKTVAHKLEIGLDDVDGQHVYVRTEGRILRTLVNLYAVLDRPRDEWRSNRVIEFDPHAIVEIHRTGLVSGGPDAQPIDLALDAMLGPTGWAANKPFEGALDPTYVLQLLGSVAGLKAKSFVDEATGHPETYGLDHPALRFEVIDSRGGREVASFVKDPTVAQWIVGVESEPYVWRIDDAALMPLLTPTDVFLDRQFERMPKNEINAIRVAAEGKSLVIERAKVGWTVAELVDHVARERVPADDAKVDDLLGAIGRIAFVQRVTDATLDQTTVTAEIGLRLKNSEIIGRFGAEHKTPEGGHGFLFQRDGESLVFLVDPSVRALATQSVDGLRSRQVLKLRELDLRQAGIKRGDRERHFIRSDRGRWSPDGVDQEAKQFAEVVDRLISVRAKNWLASSDDGALTDSIAVTFKDAFGNLTRYSLGRLDARVVCEFDGRRAEVEADLLDLLAKLLAP